MTKKALLSCIQKVVVRIKQNMYLILKKIKRFVIFRSKKRQRTIADAMCSKLFNFDYNSDLCFSKLSAATIFLSNMAIPKHFTYSRI